MLSKRQAETCKTERVPLLAFRASVAPPVTRHREGTEDHEQPCHCRRSRHLRVLAHTGGCDVQRRTLAALIVRCPPGCWAAIAAQRPSGCHHRRQLQSSGTLTLGEGGAYRVLRSIQAIRIRHLLSSELCVAAYASDSGRNNFVGYYYRFP